MKNTSIQLLIIVFLVTLFSCDDTSRPKNTNDLLTAQNLGYAYLEEFKLDEAEFEFLRVIELTPNKIEGYANLGLTYLRMGKYDEAKKQLEKAIEIDSENADTRLLLATVYQMNGESEQAVAELDKTLEFAPNHIKTLYTISELHSVNLDENSQKQRKNYLSQLVKNTPENLVPKLLLTELFIKDGEADKAVEQLEIIKKQFPEFPKEAHEYYNNAISLLKNKDTEKATIPFMIFHNYLKVSFPYQTGITILKGPGGSLIGFPMITYNDQSSAVVNENESILDILKFSDITTILELESISNNTDENQHATIIATADYDSDGNDDFYVSSFDAKTSTYKHYLFNNDMFSFTDVSKESGLKHSGKETDAIFVDYDNDGFLDLYIVKENGDVLYRNAGKGTFEDITEESGIDKISGGNKALFVDLDHDGDLDLFKTMSSSNLVYRNNGDGTFEEQATKMGLSGNPKTTTTDTAFGDFDDDGDIDLIVINPSGNNILYSNERQSTFKDITKNSGLKSNNYSSSVAVGDFNNDGFLDLLITSTNGEKTELYQNLGDGTFEILENSSKIFAPLKNTETHNSTFFDFDNDGFLDILITGISSEENTNGVFLFHNEGDNNFTNVTNLLPENLKSGNKITLLDYNNDGDLDVLIGKENGGISFLRNDGGSMNHYVNMKLLGLRTGSAKNNYFGIGAKVEIRSGDLYQTMVVTKPTINFGLGHRSKADIIRITWTNGVPQNILLPDSDKTLIESQTLKGSCPFLYTWNGEKYVFVKDITWRSALGMPLGIMGGTTMYGFAAASDDYIKVPGEFLKPKDGKYSIKVTSELWETIYMDKIELVAVDHPNSIDVFVPEQFSPPPFPGLDIHQVEEKHTPVLATNANGDNLLEFITKKDDSYLADFNLGKYQGFAESHDLILDPGKIGNNNELYIYLNGWIFPTDASINVALSQSEEMNSELPIIQVINKKGEWQTIKSNFGFPMGKDKNVIANLSGKFLTNDYRVRILTNMEIYWDEIFFTNSRPNTPIQSTVLKPITAEIHYRGFSKTYKKGGRYGPHWFDYYTVDKNKKWRDLIGDYTRYGDVLPLLKSSDNKYIISNAGDETSIQFNYEDLPKLKDGWKRDFFIRSVGWVKDGDINTALGQTVLPLPFHSMETYPPSKNDSYPINAELQKYLKDYNTRTVTMDDYRNSIKNNN